MRGRKNRRLPLAAPFGGRDDVLDLFENGQADGPGSKVPVVDFVEVSYCNADRIVEVSGPAGLRLEKDVVIGFEKRDLSADQSGGQLSPSQAGFVSVAGNRKVDGNSSLSASNDPSSEHRIPSQVLVIAFELEVAGDGLEPFDFLGAAKDEEVDIPGSARLPVARQGDRADPRVRLAEAFKSFQSAPRGLAERLREGRLRRRRRGIHGRILRESVSHVKEKAWNRAQSCSQVSSG